MYQLIYIAYTASMFIYFDVSTGECYTASMIEYFDASESFTIKY